MVFDKSIIASNIKILRKRKWLTQQQLGDHLDHKSDTIVSNWETKRTEPGWEDIEKMAVLFKVPVEEITKEAGQLTTDSSKSKASSPVQDIHIRKIVREVLAEDSRLKLIEQYLEKVIGLLEPATGGEKMKLPGEGS